MQQIKKELQQTIAKLKSEWGINNFSLQDLAAILEKVVAAVDKAAQLPAVPPQPEYVGGVIRGKVIKYFDTAGESEENAPQWAVPAFMKLDTPAGFKLGFYDEETRIFYTRKGGSPASDFIGDCIIEEYGNFFFPYKLKDNGLYQVNLIPANDAQGI